jgi:glycogen debranching enzyme
MHDRREADQYCAAAFKELWTSHLAEGGLLHISEIFTPNPPFTPNGAIAQAWSMAEIIRILTSFKTDQE